VVVPVVSVREKRASAPIPNVTTTTQNPQKGLVVISLFSKSGWRPVLHFHYTTFFDFATSNLARVSSNPGKNHFVVDSSVYSSLYHDHRRVIRRRHQVKTVWNIWLNVTTPFHGIFWDLYNHPVQRATEKLDWFRFHLRHSRFEVPARRLTG
jgi:hypothetical protein